MSRLSVLDLAPIPEGMSAGQALANAADLAQLAEGLGFHRFWLAEHHSMPGIASAATSVVIGHVAAATKTIRVGAGGIMLPNHAPLIIAEQFGTLAALHPGRIDLGLGRAPGTDMATARALRRNLEAGAENFPADVVELMDYFRPEPGRKVRAIPGEGESVEFWMLGSSLYGAQLAAALGLPYAFASHFAPAALDDAIAIYRERFRPSPHLDRPHVMAAMNVFAADTEAEARLMMSSLQQAFVRLGRGETGPLPAPVENYEAQLDPMARARLDAALSCSAVGTGAQVRAAVDAFARRTGADEIMVTSQVFDHAARRRSFEILAEACADRLEAA
ncbi:LLM class flavin-dependent oxidoreductase [Glycocaulis profundi]|nr:LLM class flavin-dependent oxidoreductase [Glycocaulis profundi]